MIKLFFLSFKCNEYGTEWYSTKKSRLTFQSYRVIPVFVIPNYQSSHDGILISIVNFSQSEIQILRIIPIRRKETNGHIYTIIDFYKNIKSVSL